MVDDGRSGRGMAGGNMGELTPLEAFMSDDAKRGRVWHGEWMDGQAYFKRIDDDLWIMEEPNGPMRICEEQVAAMSGTVTWADEPKTLTPQEALRALADGKAIEDGDFRFRLGPSGKIESLHIEDTEWEPMEDLCFVGCHIVPDPSQPAEPPIEFVTIPVIKGDPAGDAIADRLIASRQVSKRPLERKPEPQVEYPLTYAEAYAAMHASGGVVAREGLPNLRYRYNSECGWFEYKATNENDDEWTALNFEVGHRSAKWRIVDGGK